MVGGQQTQLHVENVRIMGVFGQGIDVPTGGPARQLFVKDTTISDAGTAGILLTGPGPIKAFLDNVRIERIRSNGLRAEAGTEATIRNSLFASNVASGLHAASTSTGTPAVINVEGSTMAGNGDSGARVSGVGATIRLGNCSVTGNTQGVFVNGGGNIESYQDNRVGGNANDGTPTDVIPRI